MDIRRFFRRKKESPKISSSDKAAIRREKQTAQHNEELPEISVSHSIEEGMQRALDSKYSNIPRDDSTDSEKQTTIYGLIPNGDDEEENHRLAQLALPKINLLIKTGADLNVLFAEERNVYGENMAITPLIKAIQHPGCEIIALALIKQGADIHQTVYQRMTALHHASWEGHTTVAEALLAGGATPDTPNQFGSTPISFAISLAMLEVLSGLKNESKGHAHDLALGKLGMESTGKVVQLEALELLAQCEEDGLDEMSLHLTDDQCDDEILSVLVDKGARGCALVLNAALTAPLKTAAKAATVINDNHEKFISIASDIFPGFEPGLKIFTLKVLSPWQEDLHDLFNIASGDANKRVRRKVCELLRHDSEPFLDILRGIARHGDVEDREAAASAFGKIGISTLKDLKALVGDAEASVRAAAVGGLSSLGEEAGPSIMTALHDDSEDVRTKAVDALGNLSGIDIETVAYLVEDTSDIVRFKLCVYMEGFGSGSVPLLCRLTDDAEDYVAERALLALSQMGKTAIVELKNLGDQRALSLLAKLQGQKGEVKHQKKPHTAETSSKGNNTQPCRTAATVKAISAMTSFDVKNELIGLLLARGSDNAKLSEVALAKLMEIDPMWMKNPAVKACKGALEGASRLGDSRGAYIMWHLLMIYFGSKKEKAYGISVLVWREVTPCLEELIVAMALVSEKERLAIRKILEERRPGWQNMTGIKEGEQRLSQIEKFSPEHAAAASTIRGIFNLLDQDLSVRKAALEKIDYTKAKIAIPELLMACADPDEQQRNAARAVLDSAYPDWANHPLKHLAVDYLVSKSHLPAAVEVLSKIDPNWHD